MATTLWVLDIVGYDARGGAARVFSSKERAKAAVSHIKRWLPDGDGGEYEDVDNSTADMWSIYPVVLDEIDPSAASAGATQDSYEWLGMDR